MIRSRAVITSVGFLNRPNIPDVCSDYGVTYINLLQLIRAEAWIIG